jgi:hypothetical protein
MRNNLKFKKSAVDFTITLNETNSLRMRIPLCSDDNCAVAIGMLYNSLLRPPSVNHAYAMLLGGLYKLQMDNDYRNLFVNQSAWMHGVVLAWVRSYASTPNFVNGSFQVHDALHVLQAIYAKQCINPPDVLMAVGHIVGTLHRESRIPFNAYMNLKLLWKVPQDVMEFNFAKSVARVSSLTTNRSIMSIRNVSTWVALHYMCKEDVAQPMPCFYVLSRAVPLIFKLKFNKVLYQIT